jgi:Xaa-Pro dipeptidase
MSEMADKSALLFSVGEYQDRVRRLREALAERGVDVYLGAVPESMNYYTGFDPAGIWFYYQHVCVSSRNDRVILLAHKAESQLARTGCWNDDIRVWSHGQDPLEHTFQILEDMGLPEGGTLGMELSRWSYNIADYERLKTALPGVEIVDVNDITQEMRAVHSAAEIALIREAARCSDIGLQKAYEVTRPGVSELEVYAKVQEAMHRAGSTHQPFPTLLGGGPRCGLFHGMPTERRFEEGDACMIELWGTRCRYTANIPRTFVVGRADEAFKEAYALVSDAFDKAFAAMKPGVPMGEIDRISREARGGYDDYFPARTGFGVGLNFSLFPNPSLLVGEERPLEPGMVLSLEPSISQYKGKSIILGNVILITEDGAERLSHTDNQWYELP